MLSKKQRVSNYFNSEIQAVINKYRQLEALIPNQGINNNGSQSSGSDHTAEEGRFIESIIRNSLNKYLPKNLKAFSGFILRPEAMVGENDDIRIQENLGDQHSRQLDIIVYDTANFPVYEQFEEFAIVPPEGVIGIISVKKTLRKKDIAHELMTLVDASSLCRHYTRKEGTPIDNKDKFEKINVISPATILLSVTSDLGVKDENIIVKDLFKEFISNQEKYPYDAVIKLITVLDRFSILKAEENDSNIKEENVETTFVWYKHKINNEEYLDIGFQLIVQSILKVYYHRTRSAFTVKPGFEKIDNAFMVKQRLGFLKCNGYRIKQELNTFINLERKSLRTKLIAKQKEYALNS